MSTSHAVAERLFSSPLPVDLLATARPLVASAQDPTIRVRAGVLVRAARTPEGPGTIAIERRGERGFVARAHGPGATWLLEQAPGLVGARDHLEGFRPHLHPVVARAHHRRPALRMLRSGSVRDLLVSTVIAQRVTSREAARSWTRLVRAWGEPAPGPHGLTLPPSDERLAATPYHAFHRLGIDRSRAVRIARACRDIGHLQRAVELAPDQAQRAMTQVPGVGVWTAAHLQRVAAGDPDAVEVGDDGVKHHVAWNLAGEPRGSDERMLELLAPFAGHRGRVVRLILSAGQRPPTFRAKPRVIPVDQL